MAFPGTYNFNYYRGDTFSFIIRPKDASGNVFDLDNYEAEFTVANKRGTGATSYTAQAVVNTVDNIVTCTIDPTTGRNLTAGQTWVYDVEITDGSSIFTLLNGNITVTDDITGAA
jgi:predicted extracellular nuclease